MKTPAGFFCSWDHATDFAIEKAQKARDRQQAKLAREMDVKAKEARKAERQRKMEVKPIGYWAKRAQNAFNSYIRERDELEPCICCGVHHQGQYHAGHYRSVGGNPELRFEEDNCHKQASHCNNYKSGNLAEYRIRLIRKIGLSRVEWLEGPHEQRRYRKDDYQEIEALYKKKLAELKQQRA